MRLYLMYGGPESDNEDGFGLNEVRTSPHYIGACDNGSEAIAHLEGLYEQKQIVWFEVIRFVAEDGMVPPITHDCIYSDTDYDRRLAEIKAAEEKKSITPKSFVLFYGDKDTVNGQWGWATYGTLEEALSVAKACNPYRWTIRSQPQGKDVCNRVAGFPGNPIGEGEVQYQLVQQLMEKFGLI